MRQLKRAIEQREFSSPDELQAFLDESGGQFEELDGSRTEDIHEQAQELAYRAEEAATPEEAVALLREALELDPRCVDALRQSAAFAPELGERINALEQTVQVGEASLGKEQFAELRGHFWGALETRPYMRARLELALALEEAGRVAEAISHYVALLELNPGDNQGVRDLLLPAHLRIGDSAAARRAIRAHAEGSFAVYSWGTVLERVLVDDIGGAVRALSAARDDNPHVEDYFFGRQPPPSDPPAYFTPGEESEAQTCAYIFRAALAEHRDLIAAFAHRLLAD